MNTVFITATDTGAGKTTVAAALVGALAASGLRVAAFKPVASGAEHTALGLRNEDALALMNASNVTLSYDEINPYCFESPIAPHLAAAASGVTLDAELLAEHVQRCGDHADVVVVEGAGGWLVPLSATQTFDQLALALRAQIVLVVPVRLGCINHALLSREAILRTGAPLLGWVANLCDPHQLAIPEQIDTLTHWLGIPPLAVLPHLAPGESGSLRLDALVSICRNTFCI
jgi:dethiobiotin synthetase